MAKSGALPHLDLTAAGFSTRSTEVLEARAKSWCARTPFGWAVLRHREAGLLLRDRRFRQGSHAWPDIVGIKGPFADFWKRSVISLEGAPHKQVRAAAQAALAEDHILDLNSQFRAAAEDLTRRLRGEAEFEFVDGFAEPFAGLAIASLLGTPEEDAPLIARDAATLGLAMGPDARDHEDAFNAACVRLSTMADQMLKDHPPGGFVARLLAEGLEDRQTLIDLIVISIFGGVDTTRAQLSFAVELFAHHPDQWTWLQAHRDRIPDAIAEVIRTRPTTTWATREALEDVEFGGVLIKRGQTIHILVHASATDPNTGHGGGFDVTAKRKGHFGFGGGAHHCLGHFVARTDMAAALGVLLDNWTAIELVGTPEHLPDSGNTSPKRLMVRPLWA